MLTNSRLQKYSHFPVCQLCIRVKKLWSRNMLNKYNEIKMKFKGIEKLASKK